MIISKHLRNQNLPIRKYKYFTNKRHIYILHKQLLLNINAYYVDQLRKQLQHNLLTHPAICRRKYDKPKSRWTSKLVQTPKVQFTHPAICTNLKIEFSWKKKVWFSVILIIPPIISFEKFANFESPSLRASCSFWSNSNLFFGFCFS